MKKEYMRPELTVLSLVVEDNTNVAPIQEVSGVTFNKSLDDDVLSVSDNNALNFITSMFS